MMPWSGLLPVHIEYANEMGTAKLHSTVLPENDVEAPRVFCLKCLRVAPSNPRKVPDSFDEVPYPQIAPQDPGKFVSRIIIQGTQDTAPS